MPYRVSIDGQVFKTGTVNLAPGQSRQVTRVPVGDCGSIATVRVELNPAPHALVEPTYSNNTAEADLVVPEAEGSGGDRPVLIRP